MAKLLITTQVYENYGSLDWDGTGECPQYWKAKGAREYVVKNLKEGEFAEKAALFSVWNQVEYADEYYRETIIATRVVEDDYLTSYEKYQLAREGRIIDPAKELLV